MKTVGRKQKSARHPWVLCCAQALAMLMPGLAGAAGVPDLTVHVRVYDYAGVSGGVLRSAEKEANRIFTAAGIEMTWVGCPTTPIRVASRPPQVEEGAAECSAPIAGGDIVLRILPRSTPASQAFGDTMFGFAEGTFVASVFYARVEDLARGVYGNQTETPVILGDVIAHEMGHLLLGTNSHSRAGIMCGKWDREYLRLAQEGFQTFSAEQSALMRETVVRRLAASVQP
ncbi:MAG TPA: hypothetical protein VMT20_28600 [Terriglobia bacterium]|nr:hypothetical protein [Terriglobia bacterium]